MLSYYNSHFGVHFCITAISFTGA